LENIKENIITLAKESLWLYVLKQHKPWVDEGCLRRQIKGKTLKCSGYVTQPE